MSRHEIFEQALEDIHFDPLIAEKKFAKELADLYILRSLGDTHLPQVDMWVCHDKELRRMWHLDYEKVGFVIEDQTERKDCVVRKAVTCLGNDDRFAVTWRCYMLCAFGTAIEFARMYESFEVSG